MTSTERAGERLRQLADLEFAGAKSWLGRFASAHHRVALMIEICRVMDYSHVVQTFSNSAEHKLSEPDFDIMMRGWNAALGLLMPDTAHSRLVPLMPSTPDSRSMAMTFLHQLGRSTLLKQAADLVWHGLAEADLRDDAIVLRMSQRSSIDHFADRLDAITLQRRFGDRIAAGRFRALAEHHKVQDLEARMAALVFPWDTPHGTMIGYGAEPDIDQYFEILVAENTIDWRNDAGVHPDADIDGVSGAVLAAIGLLLTSFRLKHLRFVGVGVTKISHANYHMSLTIWKDVSEFRTSVAEITGLSMTVVRKALDLMTATRREHEYFLEEQTPFVPMLIEVSDNHVLFPVSSIFRNPFQGVRMLQESRSPRTQAAIRAPRERWMIEDLCHLFLGTRYLAVDQPTRLSRHGSIVTDIDAAVLDRTTGTLALFQLKWQDFGTSEIKKQRSKAKNFVEQIDSWAAGTQGWIDEFGTAALCSALRLRVGNVRSILLFAIGRSASRFQSYGYVPRSAALAVCTWPQFVRLRHEIGPAAHVLPELHARVQAERVRPIDRRPLPHQIIAAGQRISFDDLWCDYNDDSEE
jgi:hypothetical protein